MSKNKSHILKLTPNSAYKVEDGKKISITEQPLQSCGCQFDCCNGLIELPNYNSVSGDTTPYALYIVDGEVVTEPIADAITHIRAFKNNAFISATSVVITVTGGTLTGNLDISNGNTRQLTATVLPTGASQVGVWSTLNGAVATVVGGLITPVGAGTTTIRFTSAEGLIGNHTVIVQA